MKKIIYIAHPIGGDVTRNIQEVLRIVRDLNMEYEDIVPFAPYIVDCLAMDDNDPEERQRGIDNDVALFHSKVINEVWLFGPKVSKGMQAEIDLAHLLGIPVISKTIGTKDFEVS